MTPEQKAKLLDIRIRAKTGGRLSREEQAFCEEMYMKYPDEYPSDADMFKVTEKFVNPLGKE